MLGFIKSVTNKATTLAASTSLGKAYGIKPELKKRITLGRDQLNTIQQNLKQVVGLKHSPKLRKTLEGLATQGHHIIKDLLKDKYLDPVVEVIGNQINEYDSIEAYQKAVLAKPSVKEMESFALSLIDVEHYKKLADIMIELQEFDTLKKPKQLKLLQSLQDDSLVQSIQEENAQLDIDKIKTDIIAMGKSLCSELKLTAKETENLVNVFEKLTQKHLKKLNQTRQALVIHLPEFLQAERARLEKAHPELLVQEKPSKSVTTQYKQQPKKQQAKKEKSVPVKKAKPEVVVIDLSDSEEETVKEEASSKKTKAKVKKK